MEETHGSERYNLGKRCSMPEQGNPGGNCGPLTTHARARASLEEPWPTEDPLQSRGTVRVKEQWKKMSKKQRTAERNHYTQCPVSHRRNWEELSIAPIESKGC